MELDLSAPVARWFQQRFAGPTEPQRLAWPRIAAGHDTLVSAPTGSGKTLAGFLVVLDRLVRRSLAGELEDRLEAIYVSPLRALSHDIHRNLEEPLAEIRREARRLGLDLPEIRAAVRTGDTPQRERQSMLRRPPHILVTTPESLYLLLTAEKGRELLRPVRTLIVDEIHALVRDKRGSHLSLSLARLDGLVDRRPARIGLSATQRPIQEIGRFLVGSHAPAPQIVDLGHQRDLDLAIEVPGQEDLQAVAATEQWGDLLDRLADRVRDHHTTLVFVNTRRLAERLAQRLEDRLGAEAIAAHHGSLSRERRAKVEAQLKAGSLRALVTTASLELGIDIGSVDLVCQIGSPRSIATLLQRIGRSGHALGLRPKGRLYPTSRDELIECAALVRAVRAGRLDCIHPPRAPLDILAQQIVAACAAEERSVEGLLERFRSAAPYCDLEHSDYLAVLEMLSRGFETPRGRRGAWIHWDRIAGRLRARRGARLAALRSGGAIPDMGDYRVVLDPDDTFVGTVNEDWAVESMPGDVFLLGSHSWRIRRVETGRVRVVDAQGAPPTIPFWLGEAPARTEELSREVSELRREVRDRLEASGPEASRPWLERECGLDPEGARQIVDYVRAQLEAVGVVPSCEELLVERFFDDAGGMQLVIHSPLGARINRGFGLALRKRFCRAFDQELQAAATDDALVLSLGNPQTFPLESVVRFLSAATIEDTLEQALLGSPLFQARWRWNATRSLAVLRTRGKGRVPFAIQRMQADDLMAAAFPDQAACQENVQYPIDIPDHPLVRQTLRDALHEACDLEGLRALLERIASGAVRVQVRDTVSASPFAHEILNAKPYAFLDDAPLEERRTRAVQLRHVLPESARDLAKLDPEAIARVRDEAIHEPRDPDELYELLCDLGWVRSGDLPGGAETLRIAEALVASHRATRSNAPPALIGAEGIDDFERVFPSATLTPELELPEELRSRAGERELAIDRAVRGHIEVLGPTTAARLAERLGLEPGEVEASLIRWETRGAAVRGEFDPALVGLQFCDRSLLARIHRYTIAELRRGIEPVSARACYRFLLRWQHLHPETRLAGEGGAREAIAQLSGFEAAAGAWEAQLLAARVDGYRPELLDRLCLGGEVAWGRLCQTSLEARARPSRATPIALFPREEFDALLEGARPGPLRRRDDGPLGGPAKRVLDLLEARGALFAGEIQQRSRLLPVQVEEALRELVARGRVSCDGFAPLRRLLAGSRHATRPRPGRLRVTPNGVTRPGTGRGSGGSVGMEGRWGLLAGGDPEDSDEETRAETTARRLLRRYGVVFRDLLAREWLPEGWRPIHRALRRMEARGKLRGGRFVSGFVGEQFALPEAIPLLRRERKGNPQASEIRIGAADPLNLVGILTPGPRIPAGHTRALIVRDGLPVAVVEGGARGPLGGSGGRDLDADAGHVGLAREGLEASRTRR